MSCRPFATILPWIALSLAFLMGLAGCCASLPASDIPVAGDTINLVTAGSLLAPEDEKLRSYLGLPAKETFRLEDIQADLLIVEFFDMYCPHCQREAPNVNRLYRRIAQDPGLHGRVKLIGIGVGNTRYEVDLFAKTFAVPFPLFPDRERHFVRQLDVRQTPTFVGLVPKPGKGLEPVLHAPGPLGNVEDFLDRLLRMAFFEQPPS